MQMLIADSMPERGESGGEWSHLAALSISPREISDEAASDWFAACHRLTSQVERIGRWSALLDLGVCTDAEAVAALGSLVEWLTAAGFEPVAGIAPSAGLAQLAQFTCAPRRPLVVVTPRETPAFLQRVSVAALPQLHPRGLVTPEVVERLQRYGLRTLGHVARIDELALRRQFGAAGSFLAALAQGRDARPLYPTPLPPELRIRARFAAPVTFEELLSSLPRLAERAAERLRAQGRQARSLRLGMRWESGGVTRSRLALRQYTDSPMLLAQELGRLVASATMPDQSGQGQGQPAVEAAHEGLAATTSACADSTSTRGDRDAVGARPALPPACADWDRHRGHQAQPAATPQASPPTGADFRPPAPCAAASAPRRDSPTVRYCSATETICRDRIEELRLTLMDFAPATPDQATFWRTRAQQVAAVEQVAETLTRRHGRPMLFRPRFAVPAAIFDEERYFFTPPDVALPDVALPGAALSGALTPRPGTDAADLRVGRGRPKRAALADVAGADDADAVGDAWRDVPQRVHWW